MCLRQVCFLEFAECVLLDILVGHFGEIIMHRKWPVAHLLLHTLHLMPTLTLDCATATALSLLCFLNCSSTSPLAGPTLSPSPSLPPSLLSFSRFLWRLRRYLCRQVAVAVVVCAVVLAVVFSSSSLEQLTLYRRVGRVLIT